MGKFILGLILGAFIGILAVGYNPGLAERVQDAVADVTGMVLRGTQDAAESVGQAARKAAGEAEEAVEGVDVERSAEEAAEETGQAIEGAAERTGEAVEDAAEGAAGAGREAGQEIERRLEDDEERPATGAQ